MNAGPRRLIALIPVLGLSACATLPRLSPDEAEAVQRRHETTLAGLPEWRLSGKISVNDGDDAFSGRVLWERSPGHYELVLLAPMSRGTWRLEGRDGEVVLTDEKQQVWRGSDAGELLSERAGWTVPVDALLTWVRGMRPEDGEAEIDAWGRLRWLREGDWTVSFQAWQESQGLQMPRTLVATNEPYRLKLVIHEWSFPSLDDRG